MSALAPVPRVVTLREHRVLQREEKRLQESVGYECKYYPSNCTVRPVRDLALEKFLDQKNKKVVYETVTFTYRGIVADDIMIVAIQDKL